MQVNKKPKYSGLNPGMRQLVEAAGRVAGYTVKRLIDKRVSTRKRSYRSGSSRVAGRYRNRGKKVYFRRGRKRMMRSRFRSKYVRVLGGSSASVQRVNNISDSNCVHLNVAGLGAYNILRTAINGLMLKLFQKAGRNYDTVETVIDGLLVTDFVKFEYRSSVGAALSSSVVLTPAANATVIAFASEVVNKILTVMPWTPSTQLKAVSLFIGGKQESYMDLDSVKIDVLQKTSLKMQNRSYNTGGITEQDTEIDRCPVRARMFYGRGSLPIIKDNYSATTTLDSGNTNDSVTVQAAGSVNGLKTILQPYDWKFVSRTRDYTIQPGDIKTEVLTNKLVRDFSLFCGTIAHNWQFGNQKQYMPWGNFKLISIEKVIGNDGVGNVGPVLINYEFDTKIYAKLKGIDSRYNRMYNMDAI